jgi:hypothetical protein
MSWFLSAFRLILTIVLVLLGFYFLRPTDKVLWQSCQPMSLIYSNSVHYCVTVIEGGYSINFFTNKLRRGTFVFVGPERANVTDGHLIEYQFHIGEKRPDVFYQQLHAEWTEQYLKISEPSGHTITVPSEAYTGNLN